MYFTRNFFFEYFHCLSLSYTVSQRWFYDDVKLNEIISLNIRQSLEI
jgi:hypothetical protein